MCGKRMQADGEEMVGRLRRDTQALLKNGRTEIVRDVRRLAKVEQSIAALERRVAGSARTAA
jgi:hypothetical protein